MNVKRKNTKRLVLVTSIFLIVMVVWFAMPYFTQDYYPYLQYHMMSGWMMPFGMILMILVWISCIYIVLAVFDNRRNNIKETSLSQLKNRLACGEISIEEYESIYQKIKENQE